MELKIHDYQISILRELLFKPGARFRDLKKVDVANDHFSFHINHLIQEGLITKTAGKYSLTQQGKEFANRMDTDALKLERQGKIAVALHPLRTLNGHTEYLVHKRLKEPFFGWYGSQSGKVRWGETPLECAKRELLEETGLTGNFKLRTIEHYHHIHSDGRFLEDKYFWVYTIDNLKGELKEKVPEGENIWMTKDQYQKLKHVFADFEIMQEAVTSKTLKYIERVETVDEY